jgi:hypothetical protein
MPIPAELHSVYEGGPFRVCSVCSFPLGAGCLYEIQKVFRRDRVVFEMALCQHCGEKLCREFSRESTEALKGFLLSNFRPSPESCHCHFCGFPRVLFREGLTLIGACQESSLILPPIVLCGKCEEALQGRISQKTRAVQEDFVRQNFPGVPCDLDLNPTFGGVL